MRAFGRVNFGETRDSCGFVSGVNHHAKRSKAGGDQRSRHLATKSFIPPSETKLSGYLA